MSDPTYPLFPVFSFLGIILALIPLSWHLEAWNSGTCFFMIWTAVACLNTFVNSVVWAGNALNPAPIWCDISIRITLGASVGIPAASLCIVRRLHRIATVQTVSITRAEKRQAVLIDSLICLLLPVIYIALQYVVQGHRFNIYEDIGCFPALYNTFLMYLITYMLPLLLGLITAVYCVLALRAFYQRQIQFRILLAANSSFTVGRYFRLMALAMTQMMCTVPLNIFVIWLNATTSTIGPWRSWSDTHLAFSRVEQIPALLWRLNNLLTISLELTRWLPTVCAIIFFGFFGFAQEARKHYRTAFWAVAKRIGYHPPPTQSSTKSSLPKFHHPKPPPMQSVGTLPAFVPPSPTDCKRPASPSSFGDSTSPPSYKGIPLSSTFTVSDYKDPVSPVSSSSISSSIPDDVFSTSLA